MKRISKALALLLAATLMLSCFAGCGSKENPVVGTINNVDIPGDVYLYFLFSIADNFQNSYDAKIEDVQDQLATETMTVKEYVQGYALSSAERLATISAYFDELGLTWTDEDQQLLETALEASYANYENGEETVKSALATIGLSQDQYKSILRTNYKYDKIVDALYGDSGKSPILMETAKEDFHKNYARVKNILIPTIDLQTQQALSDEEVAAAKTTYEEAMAKVDALNPGDEAGFNTILAQYNKDTGMDSNPDGYVLSEGSNYVEEFIEASLSIDDGEYTSCESAYGYHIIMRLETRDEDIVSTFGSDDDYLASYRSSYFSSDLERMIETYELKADEKAQEKIYKKVLKALG